MAESVKFGRKPGIQTTQSTTDVSQVAKPEVTTGGYEGPVHINGEQIDYGDANINLDDIPF